MLLALLLSVYMCVRVNYTIRFEELFTVPCWLASFCFFRTVFHRCRRDL